MIVKLPATAIVEADKAQATASSALAQFPLQRCKGNAALHAQHTRFGPRKRAQINAVYTDEHSPLD